MSLRPHRLHKKSDFSEGIRRFVIGLSKKVLIADPLAVVADNIFAMGPADRSSSIAWVGITCYTLQIYFDFSAYSDMALGLAYIFGFKLPLNFSNRYFSD